MAMTYLAHHSGAQVVFDVSVALFLIGDLTQAVPRRRGASLSSVGAELVFRLVFFAGILMLPLALKLLPGAVVGGAAVFVVGTVVGWAGLLLRWWSFLTLGRYFTTVVMTADDQEVVDRGPYRVLRHPSYTGLLLALLGGGLMVGNWAGAVMCVVVVLAGLVFRLLREEKALADALGDAYVRFARSRARLVPFVW